MTSVEMKWLLRNLLADNAGTAGATAFLPTCRWRSAHRGGGVDPDAWALTDIDGMFGGPVGHALPTDFAYDRWCLQWASSRCASPMTDPGAADPNSHVTETNPFHVIENETIVHVDAARRRTTMSSYVRTPAEMITVELSLLHFHNAIIDRGGAGV